MSKFSSSLVCNSFSLCSPLKGLLAGYVWIMVNASKTIVYPCVSASQFILCKRPAILFYGAPTLQPPVAFKFAHGYSDITCSNFDFYYSL
jgi:hypothetical protein